MHCPAWDDAFVSSLQLKPRDAMDRLKWREMIEGNWADMMLWAEYIVRFGCRLTPANLE